MKLICYLFSLFIIASPAASSVQSFQACGKPSERWVDIGAPTRIVDLTYPPGTSDQLVTLSGGIDDEINDFLENLKLPIPDTDFLCIVGTKPVAWSYGMITTISSYTIIGLPGGVSIGN